ncbi:MAG: energy transducer TonB [Flavobacterium sp.]|nr:energy transducer TonB [Flavobacterium sp.]
MSNVSIYEKKWLDLVFEGKNKAYGAYQLREDDSRTTAQAFIFGVLLLSSIVFVLSSFTEKPDLNPTNFENGTIIKLDNYKPPTQNSKSEKQQTQKIIKTEVQIPKNLSFVPVKSREAPEQINVPETPKNSIPDVGTSSAGSTLGLPTTENGGIGTSINIEKPKDDGVKKSFELDRQPDFNGGIKGFYEYIGNNFDRSNLDEDTVVRVLVSFVIEKDGSMTDIKVLHKTNSTIDNEAIRVLKSIKVKWTPGIKDGEPVRTQFTQPIVVKG